MGNPTVETTPRHRRAWALRRSFLLPVAAVATTLAMTVGILVVLAPTSDAASRGHRHHAAHLSHAPRTGDATPTSNVPAQEPAPAPAPAPTSAAPASSALPLKTLPWWGGSSYYAKFPKATQAGWTSPSFFPIAVFYGKPEHAAELKDVGVNTYMGAEHDGSPISSITGQGISVVAQNEWTSAEVGSDPLVVGWHASDECDMGYSGCNDQGDNEQSRLAIQTAYVNALRAKNDGRFIQANFGNGVLGTYWAPTTMKQQVDLMDVSSVDKYAYTSTHVQDLIGAAPTWPAGRNPRSSAAYGWLQERMASYSGSTEPNWVFVETSKPYLTDPGATTITVDQLSGAVWNAIINGAAGIAYFQHSNDGCGNYSLVQCSADLKNGVRAVDQQVKDLAPVINSPSYAWSFGPGLDTALKAAGGSAYIMAMTDGGTGSRTFALPPGVAGASVEVVGEGRTIPIIAGRFTDSFAAESSHHIYRVALG